MKRTVTFESHASGDLFPTFRMAQWFTPVAR